MTHTIQICKIVLRIFKYIIGIDAPLSYINTDSYLYWIIIIIIIKLENDRERRNPKIY